MNEYIHAELLLIIVMCRCALSGAFLNYQQYIQNTIMNELVKAVARLSRKVSEGTSLKECLGHFPPGLDHCSHFFLLLRLLSARGAWWGSVQIWLGKAESLPDSFSVLASFPHDQFRFSCTFIAGYLELEDLILTAIRVLYLSDGT